VEAIHEAAVQVFTEKGYDRTTTDLIAERAGVSVGTLYQYFPNKKAILIEIWDRSMSDADEFRDRKMRKHRCDGAPPLEILKWIVKGIYQLHKDTVRPQLFFEVVAQPDFIKRRMAEKESISLGLFAGFLRQCPNLRKRDVKLAARMMFEVLERLIHRYLSHFNQELSEDAFVTETSDMLCRYLFADKP
jgi:AcrR family transcriptional regulator